MSPVPFGRRDRLTSAVGPEGSGSNPGSACAQIPEKSGITSAPSLPPLAGPTVGATTCPRAGVTTAAASVSTKRKFRDCESIALLLFSFQLHRAILWVLFRNKCIVALEAVVAVGMWATPFALPIMSTAIRLRQRVGDEI